MGKTPKEYAEELINEFSLVGLQQRNEGIACAKIAVDRILNINYNIVCDAGEKLVNSTNKYFEQVKAEIEKL